VTAAVTVATIASCKHPVRGLTKTQVTSILRLSFKTLSCLYTMTGPPGILGNRRSLKFPARIPGNFEDFPKLSLFFWIVIVPYYVKPVLFELNFGEEH